MDFGLTETQEMVRRSAREFLDARESVTLARRSHSEPLAQGALWNEIRGLGWPGLAVEERYGGSGLSFDDLCVLLEECAAGLMPGPLFEATVLGASILSGSSNNDAKATLLPQVAGGDAVLTLAHLEANGRWDAPVTTTVERSGSDLLLRGQKRFVPAAGTATHFIVSALDERGRMMLVVTRSEARGVSAEAMKVASGESYAAVHLNGVKVGNGDVLAAGEDAATLLDETLQRAATARSVQISGIADAVVRRTIGYVSDRRQFGRPVGSFQAIQHRLADMATAARSCRNLARAAAWHISNGRPSLRPVARAKSFASEQAPKICWDAHQCHGAIGFTWEHDLHLFTRRVVSWRAEYGDTRFWRRIAAGSLLGN